MIQWIQSADQLQQLIKQLTDAQLTQPYIALDTEFVRTSQFFARPGLLQLSWQTKDKINVKLIDIFRLKRQYIKSFITQLYQQCEELNRIIVMHAPNEDFALFDTFDIPRHMPHLLDTQIGALYLHYQQQISLTNLATELLLNASVSKSHARSDWTQRPLKWSQLGYAAEDVILLSQIAPIMVRNLQQQGLYDQVLQDSTALFQTEFQQQSQLPYSATQSDMARIQPKLRARFAHLLHWREETVRFLDIPRKWLLTNEALMMVSRLGGTDAPPKTQLILTNIFRAPLKKQQQMRLHKDAKHYFLQALDIEELHQKFYQSWQELPEYPTHLIPARLSKTSKKTLEALENFAQKEADRIQMPTQAFMKRSWLQQLMQYYAHLQLGKTAMKPAIFQGWRLGFSEQAEVILKQHWPYI